MADLEKKILEAPKLPNHIQGDGRYLMSLLKSFLEQTAEQVNLANGFSAEEINPEAGGYPMPRDFFLSFTRLGGELSWSHIYDVSNLAYYELRMDDNIGSSFGLLERTIENHSVMLPPNYVDSVYLYAVSKDGNYSNPSVINYSKARPDAPQDLTVTKTSEGTLITFLEIPSNCIGANIYVDNKQFKAVDNIYLVTELSKMEKVEVAYYDQFGEGERASLYLVLPDITGFLVERNGADLDFYWEPVNVYGVKYIVKVGTTNSWADAIELFRTSTNDKNRRIYPNTGQYYLMVKAYDDNGNYSQNAAYQIMNNEPDISRNVILEYDQNDTLYSGTKINVFYDVGIDGVTLDREALAGEYIFGVNLEQRYRARNWLEFSALSVTNNDLTWDDLDFAWDEANQQWAGVVGDVDSGSFKSEIALKLDQVSDNAFSVDLNNELVSDQGIIPFETQHVSDYRSGRWVNGLYIDMLTKLAYDVHLDSDVFGLFFNLKTFDKLNDTVLMILAGNDNDYLLFGYDARLERFYLYGSDAVEVYLPYKASSSIEYYAFAVSQSANQRTLYVNIYSERKTYKASVEAAPIGKFSKLYCYPNMSVVN